MASSQFYGFVVSTKGKSLVASIAPRMYHLAPSRVSLWQHPRFSNPNFVSPKRLLVPLCVKKNGAIPPEFGSSSAAESRISNSNLNEAGTNKKYAKVHDFCLGIPYGGLLFIMGLIGYIVFRNPISLDLGVIPGFGTVALGVLSMMVWRKSKSNFIFILGQAVIAGFMTRQYTQAFILTQKILPWGFYAFLSCAMVCFYAYVVLSGGNAPPGHISKVV
ncbi:Protein FATTY ACID EXPORT 1 [Carex littledalei]|uniref:Protein FATTY ACID EXPORT 1 n=1 Tax=Carex littledalei TaxID=544730 RepID=A0A833RF60_9POAL|nr:Protein FATTY ACID EXPORT 1 [Carex littledalei]